MPGGRVLQWIFKPLMEGQVSRYRKKAGAEQPKFMGFPAVVLTTKGARTGNEHSHVLGGFPDGQDAWLVVASKGGAPTHPHWFVNLAKHPEHVWLEVGKRKVQVRPVLLEGKVREEALARIAAVAPRYGDYQKKTDREIPIIRLTPIS